METGPTPQVNLLDGTTIPQLGFGTLKVPPDRELSPENTAKTAEIVSLALDIGYRHIDTAQMYGNEVGVGDGLRTSGIPRDDLYVTSKLANGNHRPEDVRRSFEETLAKLDLEHLDLFLMHWPLPTLYDGDYVSTWEAMAELLADGTLRSVGVSNFQPAHLEQIVAATGVVPVVNQIEMHPRFLNTEACRASRKFRIAIEAWSPLGHGALLDDDAIRRIAEDRGKTSAQVILRWHVQRGNIVFPKSVNPERIRENFEIFDFELSATEVDALDGLDRGEEGRIGPHPDTFDWIPSPDQPGPPSSSGD